MQLAKVYERAAVAIQGAMERPETDAATLLKLSRELRALLKEARSAVDVQPPKDERMAELARKRHAMRAVSCGVDAGTHAEVVRERCGDTCETDATAHAKPMRERMRNRCGDACETDAAEPAESMRSGCADAAGSHADVRALCTVPSTYSGTVVQTDRSTEVATVATVIAGTSGTTGTTGTVVISKRIEGYGGKGDADFAASAIACENDAAPHAEVDAPKSAAARPRRAPPPLKPSGVDPQTWEDWLTLRRTKKAPVTETVVRAIEREAEKAGMALSDALAMATAQGWQGFRAEWATRVAPSGMLPLRPAHGGQVPKSLPVGSYLAPGESPIQPF